MIRINLLGVPKSKKGKRAVIDTASFSEGPSIAFVLIIVFLIAAAGNGLWYWKLKREGEQIQKDLLVTEQENHRLAEVKIRYQEREKQKNNYQRRVDVIDQLRANQSGPVRLLSMVGETVNATDEVWLNTMNDDGTSINIKGVALSIHGVANLMKNLQRSGYFKSVEIKESYQDEKVKDMQAFVFTLVCEKQPQQPQKS